MSRIVITDHTFPGLPGAEQVAARTGAQLVVLDSIKPAVLRDELARADAALVQYAPITADVVTAMRSGSLLVRYGIGVDNIDIAAAAQAGVTVANVPDYGTDVVADHATAMLLTLMRRLPWYDAQIRAFGWLNASDVGPLPALGSATIGLVGGGRVAMAVADRLRAFGSTLIAYDPFADPAVLASHGVTALDDLDELFIRSDAVSLHAPGLPSTHHTVNAARLALMRPTAVIVNTARGSLVDSAALLDALDHGTIAAAALDVFEEEPLNPDAAITQHPKIVHCPHAGFYSDQSLRRLELLAAEEAERHLNGEPLRCPVSS